MDITTIFFTLLFGKKVGTDANGNTYYRWVFAGRRYNRERRWVIFKNRKEASLVPPEWEAWLRHAVDSPIKTKPHGFQKQPLPNLTGTHYASYPEGDPHMSKHHAPTVNDYDSWTPNAEREV